MEGVEKNAIIKGAMLLTFAGILSKLLGAAYRIPLQNIAGDFGYYIYQQIYPFIGLVMILALYGFPVAVSKLTAEQLSENAGLSIRSFYLPILGVLLLFSGSLFLGLYLGAPYLAMFIGDEHLTPAYQYVAFTFLLIPLIALFRGIFQGMQNMKPTAFSQVGDQLIRIIMIILAAYFIFHFAYNPYWIGKAAAIATLSGGLVAIIILFIYYLKQKPESIRPVQISWKKYVYTILVFGIIASLNHLVLIIIQFADVLTFIPNLQQYGYNAHLSMEMKGIFDRGQPLIQIGAVIGSSLAMAIIPTFTGKSLFFKEQIESALKICLIFASGATIGLIGIYPEVNRLLFKDLSGTLSLQVLTLAIVLTAFSITGMAILQNLGNHFHAIGYLAVTFSMKIILNQLLVPHLGIIGGSIATVSALLFLSVFVYFELKRKIPEIKLLKQMNLPLILLAGGAMLVYLLSIRWLFLLFTEFSRFGLIFYVLFMVSTGAMIYLYLLIRGRAFTESELKALPFAPLLLKIAKHHKE